MLKKLSIRNYAIIHELEVVFQKGMVIITGETGAGKSILMGALGLALGERADSALVRDRAKKTIIEVECEVNDLERIRTILEELDIDPDTSIIIRRELNAAGKSRAFINDTPVSVQALQKMTGALVDLHQQFETMELASREFQRQLLDAWIGGLEAVEKYRMVYNELTQLRKEIATLQASMQKAQLEKEYWDFLLEELVSLNWQEGEAKQLNEELNTLTHAEQIRSGLGNMVTALEEGDQPVVGRLRSMVGQLQGLSNYHSRLSELSDRLQSAYIEIKDVAQELGTVLNELVVDERRIDAINERLSLAQRLAKKHGVSDLDELVRVREQVARDCRVVESSEEQLQVLLTKESETRAQANELAMAISKKRKAGIPKLEKAVGDLLKRVGMPNAVCAVELNAAELYAGGADAIAFLFDANKSGKFEQLSKVASGGELSRLMLILKSLVASSLSMPTLIFDEIDSGISGEAAKQVGRVMEELSASHQLIAITHQPQIAARADQHVYVFKTEQGGEILTGIRDLSKEERIEAIAKMMAGDAPSKAVRSSAEEMMRK
ncbi:MAG: DNA repair protein RecN [Bacteroidota bacterium]